VHKAARSEKRHGLRQDPVNRIVIDVVKKAVDEHEVKGVGGGDFILSHVSHNKFALVSAPGHVDITLVDVNPEVLRVANMTGVGARTTADV
jgi:hypothetical protein